MYQLQKPKSILKRSIFALCILVLTTYSLMILFSDQIKHTIGMQTSKIENKGADVDSAPLFYTTIGHAPKNFKRLNRTTAIKSESFTLEISVARTQQEANKIIDDLSKIGVQAYYTPFNNEGQVVYRIRTGIFNNQETAKKTAKSLKIAKNIKSKPIKLR
ncbi:MAG: SPOR domain-containing protein [Bdellovibrionota bacterium]